MSITIIDYGSGNLRSVAKALERVCKECSDVRVTNSPRALAEASHIVLPGVGAFADCVRGLSAIDGMVDTLKERVAQGAWLLGICVGMQMLFERGHEYGVHDGLGLLKGEVVPLEAPGLKIPHMGWNELAVTGDHPLIAGVKNGDHAYFVHSYHARCQPSDLLASTQYGQSVAAVVGQGNIMGTQFHPEKSQETGLALLANFVRL